VLLLLKFTIEKKKNITPVINEISLNSFLFLFRNTLQLKFYDRMTGIDFAGFNHAGVLKIIVL